MQQGGGTAQKRAPASAGCSAEKLAPPPPKRQRPVLDTNLASSPSVAGLTLRTALGLPAAATATGGGTNHALLSPSTAVPTGATTPRDVNRATPLHQAVISAEEGQLRAALAAHPAQLDWQEEHGYTPLMSAAALKDGAAGFAMARLLVEHGAAMRPCDKEGFTCFHWAAAVGNVEALLFLGAEGGAALTSCKSRAGETALHRACRLGCLPSVAALLSPDMRRAGVDPQARNAAGETPMDVAGAFGLGGRCTKFGARVPSQGGFWCTWRGGWR